MLGYIATSLSLTIVVVSLIPSVPGWRGSSHPAKTQPSEIVVTRISQPDQYTMMNRIYRDMTTSMSWWKSSYLAKAESPSEMETSSHGEEARSRPIGVSSAYQHTDITYTDFILGTFSLGEDGTLSSEYPFFDLEVYESNQSTTLNKMYQCLAVCLGPVVCVMILAVMFLGRRKLVTFAVDPSVYIWRTLFWRKSNHPAQAQSSLSKSSQLYTPSNMLGSPSSSGVRGFNVPAKSSSPANSSLRPSPVGSTSGSPNLSLQNLWMMFGVESHDEGIKIEEIRLLYGTNDRLFFQELKTRYVKNRWLLQRWLSPLRFRNCRISQASIKPVS